MAAPRAPLNFPCANCGAQLVVDGSTQTPVCTYCNTETLLPEHIWLRFHPPAPIPTAAAQVPPKQGTPLVGIAIALVVFLGLAAAVIVKVLSGATATPAPVKSLAAAGELCNGLHAVCAADNKALLVCGPDGKMVVSETCKGPNACRASPDGNRVTCDTILADLGDVCAAGTESCSTDHKSELRCQGGHFALIATCKGPDGCTFTPAKRGSGFTLSCDDHIADVGDPCFDSERTACSSDKKAYLACTAQRFAVDHLCKQGCTTKKLAGTDKVEMTCK